HWRPQHPRLAESRSHMSALPYSIPESVRVRASRIKLLSLDVDGVLSDGRLDFSAQGEELKTFTTLDGHGIKMLQRYGIDTVIITGRNSPQVKRRASDLKVKHLMQVREDKLVALQELADKLELALDRIAYLGDDLQD